MRGIVISGAGSSGDLLAYASLLVSMLTLMFTAYWSRRSERRSHLDEYWFKQLVSPKCVEPVVQFHDRWMSNLALEIRADDRGWVENFLSKFHDERGALQEGAWVSRIFAGDYYDYCCSQMDSVEDAFVESIYRMSTGVQQIAATRSDMRSALGDATVQILAHAARIHGGNYAPVGQPDSLSTGKGLMSRLIGIAGYSLIKNR